MIGRLEDDGYVTRTTTSRSASPTSAASHAAQIVRRHRLIERFLTDVFDIPWDQVHEEAERLEHWMSPVVEERMLRAIGDAKTCPHGHPIFEGEREQGVPLADVEEGADVRVLRFENEAEDLLHYLKDSGLHPGLEGTLCARAATTRSCRVRRDELAVTRSVAETVSVAAGRPLDRAAHGAARPARPGAGALGPVGPASCACASRPQVEVEQRRQERHERRGHDLRPRSAPISAQTRAVGADSRDRREGSDQQQVGDQRRPG